MPPLVEVKGYREFQRALKRADRDVRLGVRHELRDLGRPVQQAAQALALSRIPNMGSSPEWAGMRIGVTQRLVYVAARRRGVRAGSPRARPNLADLMMTRAMEPALAANASRVEHEFQGMLDRLCDRFNGTPV